MRKMTDDPNYPLRIVPAFLGNSCGADEGPARVQALIPKSTDKLRIGLVKLVTDGSIQGFTARLKEPGYYNGVPNGLWYLDPFARQGKRSGAWATGYRSYETYNGRQTPLVSNNSNFVKGGEGEVVLIDTGCELHGYLSDITRTYVFLL